MKQQMTLRSLLVLTSLLLGLSLHAEALTIHVETPGTLSSYIAINEKDLITNLTLTGALNGTDICYISEMAGRDFNGGVTSGKLSVLDISGINIVAGGNAYYSYNYHYYFSSDNAISDYMFYNCIQLTSIAIPNSVTSIGESAFEHCTGLSSVTIGNSVTSIVRSAFYGCSKLASVNIPNSVTLIGDEAFSGCNELTSVTIPNSVTSIGINAFSGCSGLSSVIIPNSVTSIDGAFQNCTGLTSVTIPNSVTSINDAFSGCSGLTSVTIPNSVTSIGSDAFSNCRGLTSVTIPNSVTSIGSSAFWNCRGLTSVTIPNSVTSIGVNAFKGCSVLIDIICQGSKPAQLGSSCFFGVNINTCILWVPAFATEDYSSAQGWNSFNKIIEEGTIVDYDVTLQGAGQLLNALGVINLKHVTNLTISGQINGTDILLIRSKLPLLRKLNIENAIIVSGGVAYFQSYTTIDNQIGSSAFYECIGLASVTIPNSVTVIGDYAFQNCTGLTSVIIPNSVTSIGSSAFSGCTGLTSITIPNSVTSIDSSAFSGCTGLTSVTIPNSVTSIGSSAFSGCTGLKEIHSRSTIAPIAESNSFDGINKTTCTLYIPKGSYANYWLAAGWGDFWGHFTNIIEESIYYTITTTSSPVDKGSVTGAGTLDYNSDVTLTATALTGYEFVNWTVNGVEVSKVNPFKFKVTGDQALVANFQIQSYAIAATASPAGGGTVTGADTYEYGKSVSLVATAAIGYDFVNWTEDGEEVSKDLTLSFTAEAARTFVANFKIQSYDVAVEIISEGFGTVTGAGTYEYGSTATFVATPAEGYVFDKWIVNSTESTDPTLEFTVTSAVSVQAQFSLYNGMEGTEESTIAVFPTLVKDEFTIAHAEAFKMNVYDNNGRLILSKIVTDAAYVISASDWTSGIYHILLTNGKTVVKERIVKE